MENSKTNSSYAGLPNDKILFQHTKRKYIGLFGKKNDDYLTSTLRHKHTQGNQGAASNAAQVQAHGYGDADGSTSIGATENEDLPAEESVRSLFFGKENFSLSRKSVLGVNASSPRSGTSVRLPVEGEDIQTQPDTPISQPQWPYAVPKPAFSLYLPYAVVLVLFIVRFYIRWTQTQKKTFSCLVQFTIVLTVSFTKQHISLHGVCNCIENRSRQLTLVYIKTDI